MAHTLLGLVAVIFAPVCLGQAVSECPKDKPQVACFVSPCATMLCGPGTTCVENYCGSCTATCEPVVCPLVRCSGPCVNGFKKDKNGCNTCECNDPVCLPVLCAKECTNGYKLDENGCNTCQCNDVTCESACQINEKCENGVCVPEGCAPGEPIVQCLIAPCATVKCAAGTVCVDNYCGGCSASCEAGCYHGGKKYAAGVAFPAGDGCNTCSCSGANPICTKRACPAPVCTYDGKTYNVGDSFPSTDGCNTCTCSTDGGVGCTEMACGPKPGSCPKAPSGLITTCDVRCSGDAECPGSEKCCSWGCSIRCVAPTICPMYKCKACSTGYHQDENGCNTCQCLDPKCEGVLCKAGDSCKNGVCCPLSKPYVSCSRNPCLGKRCGWWRSCRVDNCGRCKAMCV